jgi:hypothetical protein
MSEPKFTKGSWEWTGLFIEVDGEPIARLTEQDEITNEANANLIAASPDLYEALKRTLHHPLHGTTDIEKERAYWEYEKTQGRGEADDMLFALAALDKAVPA